VTRLFVKDLGSLIPVTTSVGSVTNILTGLEDAYDITIYVSSSANASSTGASLPLVVAVSQLDPNMTVIGRGITARTTGYLQLQLNSTSTSAAPITLTTGKATTIPGGAYRSLQLQNLTSCTVGEPVAWASARFFV
jgi:hypothetical protein